MSKHSQLWLRDTENHALSQPRLYKGASPGDEIRWLHFHINHITFKKYSQSTAMLNTHTLTSRRSPHHLTNSLSAVMTVPTRCCLPHCEKKLQLWVPETHGVTHAQAHTCVNKHIVSSDPRLQVGLQSVEANISSNRCNESPVQRWVRGSVRAPWRKKKKQDLVVSNFQRCKAKWLLVLPVSV